MNIDNFRKLVQALREASDSKLDMTQYSHPCGTPACVLGHYATRQDLQQEFHLELSAFNGLVNLATKDDHVWWDGDEICEHFDISEQAAESLFGVRGCADAVTKAEAIAYIENFCGCKL